MAAIPIDPEGDAILEFEDKRLLVSSKVLCLVSPVFKAMFKPNFKEGVRLGMKPDEPSTIPLPEDDVEAFILFCKVIHHLSDEIPQKPDPSCLEHLACICDKYRCAGSMASYGTLWLQRDIRNVSPEDLSRLLLFAYVLNLPEPFSTISSEILLGQAGPFITLPVLTNHLLVHHSFLEEFNTRKIQLNLTLQKAIMRPLLKITKYSCDEAVKAIGNYHRHLNQYGILPYGESFEEHSFFSIIENASEGSPLRYVGNCTGPWCTCYVEKHTDLRKELQQEIENWRNRKQYLCLDCIRSARKSSMEGTCRVSHL